LSPRERSNTLQTMLHRLRAEKTVVDDRQIRVEQIEIRSDVAVQIGRQLHANAPRPQRAPPEPTATKTHRGVDRSGPKSAIRRGPL
jgi:hypothetical protein